jgi:hypothetical protein
VKLFVLSIGFVSDPRDGALETQLKNVIESVDTQSVRPEKHIIIVDGYEASSMTQRTNGHINLYLQRNRFYAFQNINLALLKFSDCIADDDVICLVDLDDCLLPGALETVAAAYRAAPKTLLTYGSYVNASGRPARFNGEYRKGRNVRTESWRATHLKTFKYRLWKHLPLSAGTDENGDWLQMCADVAIMLPLMEIAGLDRCLRIVKPIYWYNDLNEDSEHRRDPEKQKATERYIRSKSPLQRIEKI